ncbi:hypothetical protein AJ78_00668 [Emergomyces pasteurianus Ep9510]|uniref:MT-A70 family protein n=1 Tax=Emergomyces pasteurianus Ep9510 TaxID=1447872 RepID=A0A1J9PT05_9EURO|nr:hypothetical protein AJ78_00668 [Emergomyces pasteurianus Ep9510]
MTTLQNHRSAILYQNALSTVILMDIPTSIGIAQRFKEPGDTGDDALKDSSGLVLLSCNPLQHPYPNPPEPKTEDARNRVLSQIPAPQQQFHAEIVPVINNALQELREHHQGDWCFPRHCIGKQQDGEFREESKDAAESNQEGRPPKRKRNEPDAKGLMRSLQEPTLIVEVEPQLPGSCYSAPSEPPLILSPGINQIPCLNAIQGIIVQNPARVQTTLCIKSEEQPCPPTSSGPWSPSYISINIPPESTFLNCHLTPPTESHPSSIPSLSSDTKFNFILMDPPWPNRSVRRSSHYKEHAEPLQPIVEGVLQNHLHPHQAIVAIWITNSMKSRSATLSALEACGLHSFEEWIWVKTTIDGQPASPPDGLWRRPYEVLILAHKEKHLAQDCKGEETRGHCEIKRRVIVAVPDIHSRKPNIKELVETIFFSSATEAFRKTQDVGRENHPTRPYSALEVFARNLTAGWWACGNEVIRFNWEGWWDEKERTKGES